MAAWTTVERSWSEVREFLAQLDWMAGDDAYPIDIIDSVIAAGADELLAIDASMHDLVTAPAPSTPGAATDVIVVWFERVQPISIAAVCSNLAGMLMLRALR